MKPNNFTLNSDYLTIANVENKEYSITIPGGVVPAGGSYTVNYMLQCKPIKQSITRAYMHHSSWSNPNLWGAGTHAIIGWVNSSNQSIFEEIIVSTPTDSTVRVDIEFRGYEGAGANIPGHTIKLKVFRFRVPNVF